MSESSGYNGDRSAGSGRISVRAAAKRLGLDSHVLNYWQSLFEELSPRICDGQRYYAAEDMEILQLVHRALNQENKSVAVTRERLQQAVRARKSGKTGPRPVKEDSASYDMKQMNRAVRDMQLSVATAVDSGLLSPDAPVLETRRAHLQETLARLQKIQHRLETLIADM